MSGVLILDGYNLVGAIRRYGTRETGSLDASRELLISDALKAAGWIAQDIILVFDAARSPEPSRTEPRAGGAVRIIYSAPRETADDVIERLLRTQGGPVTVCSGDFALQRAALANDAVRIAPREFEDLINEMPAVTRNPEKPFRARVRDRLSPEVLRSLEELRREAEGR